MDRVFPRKSESAVATYPVKKKPKNPKDNTLGRLFSPNFAGGSFFFSSSTPIALNVWDSGNYTAGWDDDEGGTAGWTELGPLLDAHSWGGGCEHSRPKVRMPKASEFSHAFPPHHIDPSIPRILCINYGLQINAPPSAFPFFHYIRLPIIVTNQEISPCTQACLCISDAPISFSII